MILLQISFTTQPSLQDSKAWTDLDKIISSIKGIGVHMEGKGHVPADISG